MSDTIFLLTREEGTAEEQSCRNFCFDIPPELKSRICLNSPSQGYSCNNNESGTHL